MSYFVYRTSVGDFGIMSRDDYRFNLVFEGEWIGTYDDRQEAVDALCDGMVFQPRWKQLEFDLLDIPRNLLDWEYIS